MKLRFGLGRGVEERGVLGDAVVVYAVAGQWMLPPTAEITFVATKLLLSFTLTVLVAAATGVEAEETRGGNGRRESHAKRCVRFISVPTGGSASRTSRGRRC